MGSRIKKIFILLLIICFTAGCTQVKQVVKDVKEVFVKEKESTTKPPTREKEDTSKSTNEEKETKAKPASTKKGPRKTTQTPSGEVFGPK